MLKDIIQQNICQAYSENIKNLADDKDLLSEKLSLFNEVCPNLSLSELQKEITESKILSYFLCKTPNKQQIYKQTANSILKSKRLPVSGVNLIRFNSQGDIIHRKELKSTIAAHYFLNNIYWVQKYTDSSGGHQNQTLQEVYYFLENGSKKHKVGCFIDGEFWNNKRQLLQSYFKNNKNVYIRSLEDYV